MSAEGELRVVTGAFSYTGKYIARRLLAEGGRVRTLTGHPNRPNPFGERIEVAPLDFSRPDELAKNLAGAAALFNTYWVRFAYGGVTYEQAIANTQTLIRAAEQAGVRTLVHISITNPSEDSPLDYFRGKAILERIIRESRLSYAIIRPTLVFGLEDVLINNIAWLLRRFPLFAVPGAGDYRVQPVSVEDVAEIAVSAAREPTNIVRDAVGAEVFTFDELVRRIAVAIGSRARIVQVPPALALTLAKLVGAAVRDVLLTGDEVRGLMAGLLTSASPPNGRIRFSAWLAENAEHLGRRYTSELALHFR